MIENVKHSSGRSYGQFCGLARALDVIGDRWNLLIVRELLPGPLRYGELKTSLGGIATNLLTERLRTMEESSVVERQLGSAGVEYALTAWGAELREAMEALGRWAGPLIAAGRGDDAFRPRWLVLALPALMRGAFTSSAVEVGLEIEDYFITLRVDESGPRASSTGTDRPATVLMTDAETVIGLAVGSVSVEQALDKGQLTGDAAPLYVAFVSRARQPS